MQKRTVIFIVLGVLVICLGAFYLPSKNFFVNEQNSPEVHGLNSTQQQITASAINGIGVSEEQAKRRPVSVVIGNTPEARPQSGLSNASVVYETLAEGGVTRLLALFQNLDNQKIGPVRSARDYFAVLANDWQALFAHVGGSPGVLQDISKGKYPGVIDLNEFYRSANFIRDNESPAPHNVFTSTDKLYDFLGAQSTGSAQRRTLFNFKNDSPVVTGKGKNVVIVPAFSISLDFSTSQYLVGYTYNPKTNLYSRAVGGKQQVDSLNNKTIQAKTILVQYTDIFPVAKDKEGRLSVGLIGQGRAQIFMDGQVIDGTWKKTLYGRTMFLGVDGKEIAINRGQIWVEIFPADKFNQVSFDGAVVNPDGSINDEQSKLLR